LLNFVKIFCASFLNISHHYFSFASQRHHFTQVELKTNIHFGIFANIFVFCKHFREFAKPWEGRKIELNFKLKFCYLSVSAKKKLTKSYRNNTDFRKCFWKYENIGSSMKENFLYNKSGIIYSPTTVHLIINKIYCM
jgi:hypothetical protein